MTSLIVVREPAAKLVHVLSDGACWDRSGRMVARDSKALPLPHLNAVVASRGARLVLPMLATGISFLAETYDDLRERAGEILWRLLDEKDSIFSKASYFKDQGPDFEMVVAGIKHGGEVDSFVVANHARYGHDPFNIIDLGEFATLPGSPDLIARVQSEKTERHADGSVDMAAFGRRVMDLQRDELIEQTPGIRTRAAAAFIQLTTVSAAAIQTKLIHRWPDKIGDRAQGRPTANSV